MAELVDDKMDLSDGSYEMVDFEDFCYVLSDSEEELLEKIKDCEIAAESSSSDCEIAAESSSSDMEAEDYFDTSGIKENELVMDHGFQFKNLVYMMDYKPKVRMEIKDVVKEHILPFLPAKSLMRFRTVSKDWDKWILGPFLAHKQTYCFRDVSGFFCQKDTNTPTFMSLNPSTYGIASSPPVFFPEPVMAISSANGLLLCRGNGWEPVYYICNPVTKEWKTLLQPHYYYHGANSASVLAFEPSELNFSPHYELICAVTSIDLKSVCFDIYSSENKSWTRSAEECFELGGVSLKHGGFYMNGIAFWETSCGSVLGFDRKNEAYGILSLPPSCASKGVLTQMHGELCYVHAHNQDESAYLIDIYTGMGFSLKQRVSINVNLVGNVIGRCQALPCVDSQTVMIRIRHNVYSYHLRDQRFEKVEGMDHSDFGATYLPYVNSLVSVGPNE